MTRKSIENFFLRSDETPISQKLHEVTLSKKQRSGLLHLCFKLLHLIFDQSKVYTCYRPNDGVDALDNIRDRL